MKNNKRIIIGITNIFLIGLILLGLTYAYYRTRIIGNKENSISVISKKLELVYGDGIGTIIGANEIIEPGKTFESKVFTVTNTGTEQ